MSTLRRFSRWLAVGLSLVVMQGTVAWAYTHGVASVAILPVAQMEDSATNAVAFEDPSLSESAESTPPSEAEVPDPVTTDRPEPTASDAPPSDEVSEPTASDTAIPDEVSDESADEPVAEEDSEAAGDNDQVEEEAKAPTEEEWFQRELLIEADSLYLAGDIAGAETLYREAKTFGWRDEDALAAIPAEPFLDETLLSPGGAVYWRESGRGIESGRESQVLVPLGLLTTEYPEYIPGHLRYADQLTAYERHEDAAMALEEALTLYPSHPVLLQAQVQLMMDREQWIEASIAARQFALLNPDHAETKTYEALAVENLERFKSTTNAQIRSNAIANIFTGVAGYVLTGGLFGPFTALSSTMALLQGEEAIGAQVAEQARQQLPLLEDEEVNAYVDRIGAKLAAVAGRDEFEYEFDIILDENLNAFALPGGKVFVNAGAILDTDSEAELAGLLAHELSHAVLSHGFQMVTRGNLTASITQYLPLPGIVNNLLVTGYSRQMERQADIVGTQILAASSYAADGMHGLMLALEERYGDRDVVAWFSTHPAPQERVDYLQAIVENGGYNRYAYEGVASHSYIQGLTAVALEEYEAEEGQDSDGNAPSEEDIEDAVEEVKDEQEEALEEEVLEGAEDTQAETVMFEEA